MSRVQPVSGATGSGTASASVPGDTVELEPIPGDTVELEPIPGDTEEFWPVAGIREAAREPVAPTIHERDTVPRLLTLDQAIEEEDEVVVPISAVAPISAPELPPAPVPSSYMLILLVLLALGSVGFLLYVSCFR